MKVQCQYKISEPPHYLHEHRCAAAGRYATETTSGVKVNVCKRHLNFMERRIAIGMHNPSYWFTRDAEGKGE